MTSKMAALPIVLALLSAGIHHGAADEHQPYLPLSRLAVSVTEPQFDEFLSAVTQFAERNNFKIETGSFPKQGRGVVNLTVHVGDQTFFAINNFRSADRFELTAYSHDPYAWKAPWDALIAALSSKFGSGVTVYQPH